MYYRISKNEKILFFGKKIAQVWAVTLKLKCLLKKPTQDDIIEAKEVYIQQSFGRYKGKLVLHN